LVEQRSPKPSVGGSNPSALDTKWKRIKLTQEVKRGVNVGAEVKSMEIKKTHQTSTTENAVSSKKKVQDFVADIKSEVGKITWTNREELITYTKIVVVATFVLGMSIYMMDLLIQGTLSGLSLLLRLIAG
jgi:preprotein translocase subunit SecE